MYKITVLKRTRQNNFVISREGVLFILIIFYINIIIINRTKGSDCLLKTQTLQSHEDNVKSLNSCQVLVSEKEKLNTSNLSSS
jgi:hypothetical protein